MVGELVELRQVLEHARGGADVGTGHERRLGRGGWQARPVVVAGHAHPVGAAEDHVVLGGHDLHVAGGHLADRTEEAVAVQRRAGRAASALVGTAQQNLAVYMASLGGPRGPR